ncbi:MAG: flavodoxin [Mogibacterium sp.]|nr:flavodoxin [Mogibacterium sp.]
MEKSLVVYFSASGRTRTVAERLARIAGADLYEIVPEVKYTSADLNYMNKKSRSSVEMNDRSSRPAIVNTDAHIADYSIIYLGFPIWWYVAPTIVNTFLEKYDFTGKKIVLFATSGGSNFGKAILNLRDSVAKTTEVIEGKVFRGKVSDEELESILI